MAKRPVAESGVDLLSRLAPQLASLPVTRYWIDYDREADVLYVRFRRPQEATDTEMRDDGILIRYRGDEPVGVTILDASKR